MFRLQKRQNLHAGQKVFPTTTVFRFKFNADGKFDRSKSRVCVRGDLMIPDRDFGEVQSPTVLNNSVKLIISDCPSSGKIAVTSDIEQAFTYGRMDPTRPCYIKQFPGTEKVLDEDTGEELVMKLMYRLYGDPAAPRAFHAELHEAYLSFDSCKLKGCKFKQSKADPCVYYLRCHKSIGDGIDPGIGDGTLLTSAIFVDDSINTFIPGTDAHAVYLEFVQHLKSRFKMKGDCDGMDMIQSFLGMCFTWAEDYSWIRIDQPHAIDKLVLGSGVDVNKPHHTPLPPGTEIMLDDCPDLETAEGREEAEIMKDKCYRKRIGELLWIARSSRPDISAAVGRLSTVANNPGLIAWEHTSYLIQYLNHTRNLGIVYSKGGTDYPYGFVDVAFSPCYGNDDDNYRSFEGGLVKNAGGPIAWFAKFQKALALSSSESEYYGLTSMAKLCIHIKQLCDELGIYSDEPFLIYEDNKAAIKMAENSSNSKRTVHLDRRAHYIRSQVNQGNLQLDYCPTTLMQADALTKIMPRPGFEKLRSDMGLTYLHSLHLTPRLKDAVR